MNRKLCLQAKIGILKATLMTLVKYGFGMLALRKTEMNLLDIFRRKFLLVVLSTYLTDHISNSKPKETYFYPAF